VRTIAVVGASLGGLRSAEALRAQGFDGRIIVIGEEPDLPYDRPPLSKGVLLGTVEPASLALSSPERHEGLGAEWRLGVRAERLDPGRRALGLSDGSEVTVDGVVIATGGTPRTLPGTDGVDGVLTLRTVPDALALRDRLAAGPEHVVVIGAGFLGAEVTASCQALGVPVTVVEAMDVPLVGAVGPIVGAVCGQLHGDHGVPLLCGRGVAEVLTRNDDMSEGRTVRGVRLDDGRELPADLVVVAIGMRPATEWLAGSGIEIDNGVVTDAGLCTAVPGVVAVGDVARHHCDGRPTRHEHWTNAAEQPAVAVANLLAGRHTRHCSGSGYFWSDQYGIRIQFAGSIRPTDEVRVVEGALEDRKFLATYHRDGRTTGAFSMAMPRPFVRVRRTLVTTTEEADRCPSCSSTEHGGTLRPAAGTMSSTPSTRA
jgi:3-phenylpropionate/trans-cinnamate dioxygenase ferredoxin reductase subunit